MVPASLARLRRKLATQQRATRERTGTFLKRAIPPARCARVVDTEEKPKMSLDYPSPAPDTPCKRRDLAPEQQAAFETFCRAVLADGALPAKMKQIIAV